MSDIVLKKSFRFWIWDFRYVGFEKSLHTKITLLSFTLWIRQLLQFSCFSFDHVSEINSYYTSDFEMKRLQRVTIWIKKINASDFYWKILQLVRFWMENFRKCQILNWRKIQRVTFWNRKDYASDFKIRKSQSARVWNKILLEFRFRIGKIQRIRLWKKFFTRQILYIVVKKTNQILNLRCFGISDSRKLCTQRSSFIFSNPWKRYILRFSCFSWNNDFEKKSCNTSNFELKRKQCVTIWFKRKQRIRFWA